MEDLQNFTSGVILPGFQSVFTGFVLAALVVCAGELFGFGFLIWLAALTFAAGTLLCWSLLLANWIRLNAFVVGALAGQGTEPGYIDVPSREVLTVEEPERLPEPVFVRVELKQSNQLKIIDLPAQPDQLRQLAIGYLQGESLAETVWCGQGRPFSRSQYAQLRGELLKRGLAYWLNDNAPAQGWRLNAAGCAILRQFAEPAYPVGSELVER